MGAMREAVNRVRAFFGKQQRDAELEAELAMNSAEAPPFLPGFLAMGGDDFRGKVR